jgi:hypothetical protein
MKKNLTLILFTFLTYNVLAQMTVREVYDFAVGDTFQYNYNHFAINPFRQNYRQVIILKKEMDTLKNQLLYTNQVEEYTPAYPAGNRLIPSNYTKSIPFFRTENLDSIIRSKEICQFIQNPTRINYCYDSIVFDYGNRKTFKHDFNYLQFTYGKIHYAAGLGLARDYAGSEADMGRDFKLIYYTKKGQKWGERSTFFELCKLLTVREVFDFNINDVFVYKSDSYLIPPGRLDTLYERLTVLTKRLFLPDSIIYTFKNESFYGGFLGKITVTTTTLVVKDLDSAAVYKLQTNNELFKFAKDECNTLNNSNRRVDGRSLYSNRLLDFCYGYFVGQGIGLTHFHSCSFVPDSKDLIYFKKGTEIWGTPIDFTSSLFTSSVFETKIKLFPNPTHDVLTIETGLPFFQVKIINLNGQVLFSDAYKTPINTSYLPNGIYFVQVFEDEIPRGVKKIMVNHIN